jgi:hypothetical protein
MSSESPQTGNQESEPGRPSAPRQGPRTAAKPTDIPLDRLTRAATRLLNWVQDVRDLIEPDSELPIHLRNLVEALRRKDAATGTREYRLADQAAREILARNQAVRDRGGRYPSRAEQLAEEVAPFWTPERTYLLVAVVLGAILAGLLEFVIAAAPIPPGTDGGQWSATALSFVGLPYPSQIVPLQYQPALFPLLGLFIRVGGGSLAGLRILVGVLIFLLVVSTYFVAQAVLRSPRWAILVAAFVVLSPTIVRMFFGGLYPNLLGFVFMNLSVAFFIRMLRTPRRIEGLYFWLATTGAVLSEPLVALLTLLILVFLSVATILLRRFPNALWRHGPAWVGIGAFAAGAGGYYIGTDLAGVVHPSYVTASPFASVLTNPSTMFRTLTSPYFGKYLIPTILAVGILGVVTVGILAAFVVFWILKPARLTPPVLVVSAWTLAVTGTALAGWARGVVTVYGRFGVFFVFPIVLAVAAYLVPASTRYFSTLDQVEELEVAAQGAGLASSPVGNGVRRSRRGPATRNALFAVAVVAVVLFASLVTVPVMFRDEAQFTGKTHDAQLVTAMESIRHYGAPGGIFVTISGAGKWPRGVIARNTFSPIDPATLGSNSFLPSQLIQKELTYYALTSEYAITTGTVSATFLLGNATPLHPSPCYAPLYYGHPIPIFCLPQTKLLVTFVGNKTVPAYTAAESPPLVTLPSGPGAPLSLAFVRPNVTVYVNTSGVYGQSEIDVSVTAVATGTTGLLSVSGQVQTANHITATATTTQVPGQFLWTDLRNPTVATYGEVTPSTSLRAVITGNRSLGTVTSAVMAANSAAPGGARSLTFSFLLLTPGAENIVKGLPSFISSVDVVQQLQVRYVLLTTPGTRGLLDSGLSPQTEMVYLESLYGASVLSIEAPWQVMVLHAG